MDNNSINPQSDGIKLLKFLGIILRLIGFIFVGALVTMAIFGTDIAVQESFSEKDQLNLLFMQGFNHLITFIFLPLIYFFFLKREPEFQLGFKSEKIIIHLLLAILLILVSVPLINILAEWNKYINPPEFWGIKQWVTASEEKAKKLTETIAIYDNLTEMVLVLIVMAVLPAIGEEILFRGIVQNEFREVFKSPHVAIWITGFIFSFMHFQFFGFFPRMLLGIVFGYLYFWSGNLLVPIFIHFLNNALTLFAMNFYKKGAIDIDPESAENIPVGVALFSLVMLVYLLSAFKKYSQKDTEG